jgi:hypothetical protein
MTTGEQNLISLKCDNCGFSGSDVINDKSNRLLFTYVQVTFTMTLFVEPKTFEGSLCGSCARLMAAMISKSIRSPSEIQERMNIKNKESKK